MNYMKQLTKGILIISAVLLTACGSSTKLLSSWTGEEREAKTYDNLAVAALFPNSSNRYLVERAMVAELRHNKIKANYTYETFPMAGRIGDIQNVVEDKELLQKKVRQKVTENDIDALMIITLFNTKSEQRYVNNRSYTMGGTGYYGTPYMLGSYYDYYSYSIGTIYNQGYYVEDVTYFLECNLYDVENEELLWSGRTKSVNRESLEKEAEKFSGIVVKELLSKKVIVP